MNENTSLTREYIDAILDQATVTVTKVGKKTAVVTATLRNGFEITTTSACVDPGNYDEAEGKRIGLQRIEDKLWELEGYRLQCAVTGEP